MKILVLNAGSSSQKSCLYDLPDGKLPDDPPPLWAAQIDWDDRSGDAKLKVTTPSGIVCQETYRSESKSADTLKALQTLWSGEHQAIDRPQDIDLVGHRIVHGGEKYQQSTWIDADVKAEIDRLSVFAPIHNRANLLPSHSRNRRWS